MSPGAEQRPIAVTAIAYVNALLTADYFGAFEHVPWWIVGLFVFLLYSSLVGRFLVIRAGIRFREDLDANAAEWIGAAVVVGSAALYVLAPRAYDDIRHWCLVAMAVATVQFLGCWIWRRRPRSR